MQMIQKGKSLQVLVNMMNENGEISRSHGIPLSILNEQASSLRVPLIAIPTSWKDYEMNFMKALDQAKSSFAIEAMVFGDIDLQAHRDWEEMVCEKAGIEAILPLWQKERTPLVRQMLEAGIETMIVSCNTLMGESFLGKMISPELISELEELGVDPCGENGEFHTLVINSPLFNKPVTLPACRKIKHEEYWFLTWG